MISIKSQREIDKMKRAGEVVARVHLRMEELVAPGVTTAELNRAALEIIQGAGAIPSFLGYPSPYGGIDFPGAICASVNEEVIHGLPGPRVLNEGDIISVDVGAILDGWHGDAARTFPVGKVTTEAERLLSVTRESFEAGMAAALPGNRIRDISQAVQQVVERNGFGVVRDYVGHGIGTEMHEEPQIPNYVGRERGPRLAEGMVICIEPMVNVGTWRVTLLDDKWTVVTSDRRYSAHHENTITITANGPQILTRIW
jgi:methionyl aminopeptidase